MDWLKLKDRDRNFVGFLVIGFASLVGGLIMFAFIVLPRVRPESGVPRDIQMIFTRMFSNQNLVRRETGKFTPALVTVGVELEQCRRFSCLLTLTPGQDDYVFQLTKDGQTWEIRSQSPVPKERGGP